MRCWGFTYSSICGFWCGVQSMASQSLRLSSPVAQTPRLTSCSHWHFRFQVSFSLLYIFRAHAGSLISTLTSCLENIKIAPRRDRLIWKRAIIMSKFYLLEKICYDDGSKWGLLIYNPLLRSWLVFWTQARCVFPVLRSSPLWRFSHLTFPRFLVPVEGRWWMLG